MWPCFFLRSEVLESPMTHSWCMSCIHACSLCEESHISYPHIVLHSTGGAVQFWSKPYKSVFTRQKSDLSVLESVSFFLNVDAIGVGASWCHYWGSTKFPCAPRRKIMKGKKYFLFWCFGHYLLRNSKTILIHDKNEFFPCFFPMQDLVIIFSVPIKKERKWNGKIVKLS